QDGAAEPRPSADEIGPADGHRPVLSRFLQPLERRLEVVDALALLPDPGRGDVLELNLDLEDVPGEPHAAERGAKELALALLGAREDAPVGDPHAKRPHVLAEAARDVMVLSVHVGG